MRAQSKRDIGSYALWLMVFGNREENKRRNQDRVSVAVVHREYMMPRFCCKSFVWSDAEGCLLVTITFLLNNVNHVIGDSWHRLPHLESTTLCDLQIMAEM